MDNGEPRSIAFGGLRVDDAIEEALLGIVGPGGEGGRKTGHGTAGSGS